MKDSIYNASDLEPLKDVDSERIYRDVVGSIGDVRSGDEIYHVKRRFIKGYEVEVASYHILEDSDVYIPKCFYIPGYDITFTEVDKDVLNMSEFLSKKGQKTDIDMDYLKESLAAKILLGDQDIEFRNLIIDPEDGKISPVDFELSGGLNKEKRMEVKTRHIIRETDADFSYDEVLEEAEEMYRKMDIDSYFENVRKNGLYSREVDEIKKYVDGRFGS